MVNRIGDSGSIQPTPQNPQGQSDISSIKKQIEQILADLDALESTSQGEGSEETTTSSGGTGHVTVLENETGGTGVTYSQH